MTDDHQNHDRYERPWIACVDQLPTEHVAVESKIDDERGCRNEQTLKRISGLWFFPDGSMYVYYTPTHWRHIGAAHNQAVQA